MLRLWSSSFDPLGRGIPTGGSPGETTRWHSHARCDGTLASEERVTGLLHLILKELQCPSPPPSESPYVLVISVFQLV